MARKPVIDVSAWPSLTLEGNLIAPAMVASIERRQAPEQTEADYRIRRGLTIREEISTSFRVGQSHFDAFAKLQNPSVEATRRFVRGFLAETFGFDDLGPADGAISFLAGGRVPIVVVPPSDDNLDRRSATLSTNRAQSPAFALQDYLNDNEQALWGLVTNGALIRLTRHNASLTRPAYVEGDLAQIFANEDAASFAVLWSLIHRTRFGLAGASGPDCALERWREAGSREGEAARDRLAGQVETALKVLGSGFLEANTDLATRLGSGEVNLTEWFNELLRLVYRLIFLMVAEDRNLLHPEVTAPGARKLYTEGYSLAALRAQCVRVAAWDKHHDRYEGIKIVFRALAHGQQALGLPALGGLFDAGMLPHLQAARLRNRAFMEAVYRLSWLADKTGIVPVNWRAMETEELGSVYESLLELQPQLGDGGRTLIFASEATEQKGNQRKTTGSYYTPDSLVQALLDTALDPVLEKTETEAADPAEALLRLSIVDPSCGSGHFLLAAARRVATRLARIRAEGTPSLVHFRHALRDVARCCIHGVDRNPMAVELTKVALWIETVDPGLPLGFFDAQIRCGDALFGVFDLKVLEQGIPEAAYKPLIGDDKDVARYYSQKNRREQAEKDRIAQGLGFDRASDLMRDFEELRAMPENTVEQIAAKMARLCALTAQGASAWQLETACDLYVSAFLLPKRKGGPHAGPDGIPRRGAETVPTSGTIWEWLRGVQPFPPLFAIGIDAARTARAFHWPLEFPDILQQRGGFDVVLGNPPWEVMQLSDKEFFAAKKPEIAALTGDTRKSAIEGLQYSDPLLFGKYQLMKRLSTATNEYSRNCGRFALSAKGKINTFALFAEFFATSITLSGRAGVILPAEITTSETLSDFMQAMVKRGSLISVISFENEEFVFPGIANVVQFCLMTLASRSKTPKPFRIANYLRQSSQMADEERIIELQPSEPSIFSPGLGTLPIFRSRYDHVLAKKLFENEDRSGLGNADSQGRWKVESRLGLFNMASDSGLFAEQPDLEAAGLKLSRSRVFQGQGRKLVPIYEGKFISHFDHRFSSYHNLGKERGRGGRGLPPVKPEEYQDPDFEVLPRYWVDQDIVDQKINDLSWQHGWLLGWRDVANAKVERTVTFAFLPRTAVGHTCSLLFPRNCVSLSACLCANLNSLVLDYAARQVIGGSHVTFGYLQQLPILKTSYYTNCRLIFVVSLVLELTYTSHAMAAFARDLDYAGQPFGWDECRRANLRARLDAFYARAYGLTRDELRYILDPAEVRGHHYPSETFRVLKEREIQQFHEYRTRRLVLCAWDRMEANGEFRGMGM